MDHIDREILQILQHNARASLKMIAEKTFLSSTAVSARIEKLEKDGIITSYQAQIDPMKLGYHILAFINLNVLPEDKQKFYHYAEGIPNILECSSVRLLLCSSKTGRCLCAGTALSTGCLSRIRAGSAAGSSRTGRTLSCHLNIRVSISIPECPVKSTV